MNYTRPRISMKILVRSFVSVILVAVATKASAEHFVGLGVSLLTPCTASLARAGACRADYLNVQSEELTTSGGSGATIAAVHSDLSARALVIQDATGVQAVVVTVDVLFVDESWSSEIQQAIQQQYPGLQSSNIVINASHTHSAPAVVDLSRSMTQANGVGQEPPPSARYRALATSRVLSAVQAAFQSLQPAQLEFRRGKSRACAYRRIDGRSSRTLPAPSTLDTLTLRATSGAVLGVVATTNCHSVAMYGARGVISSDFAGVARARVEDALRTPSNPRPVVIYLQGFAGDMNPVTSHLGVGPYDSVAQTGTKLADEILSLNRFPAPALAGPLTTSMSSVNLPLAPQKTSWANDGRAAMSIGVQVLKIGSDDASSQAWTLLAFGGEVVSEYESYVRSHWENTKNLSLVAYSNDSPGYVPTQRMIRTDAAQCGLSPAGYEGCYSFCLRYLPVGDWTDAHFFTNREGLVDRFGDNLRSGDMWTQGVLSTVNGADISSSSVQVAQVAGGLRISPTNASGLRYGGYVTTKTHDFRGKQFGVRIVATPNAHSPAEALVSIGSSGSDLYRFDIQGGQLRADAVIAGRATYVPLGAFDSQRHRYLRLRHDTAADRMFWESSVNGSTWVTLHSRSRDASFNLSIVRAELIAGTYAPVASPGVTVFDDVVLGASYLLPRQANFVERFEDSASISKHWVESVLSSVQSTSLTHAFIDVFANAGRVEVSPLSGATGLRYNGLSTRDSFRFTGRRAVFQILGTLRQDTDAEMFVSLAANGHNGYRFQLQRGTLRADTIINGVPTYTPLAVFDPYSHRFLSLRHDAATDRVVWEASVDGTSWQALFATARAASVDLTSVQFELFAGTYVPVSNPGTAIFGAFEFR